MNGDTDMGMYAIYDDEPFKIPYYGILLISLIPTNANSESLSSLLDLTEHHVL